MTLTDIEQFTVRRSSEEQSCASFLPPAGHFIAGAFVPGSSTQLIDVVDPTTEQVISSVQAGTAADVDVAVEAAVAAQKSWGATTPKERSEVLSLIANIIEANREIIEEWKWMGSPVWSHDGIVAIANAHKEKVKLTFAHGASLSDPDKLFNAGLEGKVWRAIDFFEGDKINNRALKNLVRAAVDYNQIKIKKKAHSGTRAKVRKTMKK